MAVAASTYNIGSHSVIDVPLASSNEPGATTLYRTPENIGQIEGFDRAETHKMGASFAGQGVHFLPGSGRQFVAVEDLDNMVFNRFALEDALLKGVVVEKFTHAQVKPQFAKMGKILPLKGKSENEAIVTYSDRRGATPLSMTTEQAADLLLAISPNAKNDVIGLLQLVDRVRKNTNLPQRRFKSYYNTSLNEPLMKQDIIRRVPLVNDLYHILSLRVNSRYSRYPKTQD